MPGFIAAIPAQDSRPNKSDKQQCLSHWLSKVFLLKDIYMQNGMGYPSAVIWEVRFMTVVKSDAMLQHEKTIAEVVAHRPKRSNDEVMHIEWRNYLLAAAAVVAIAIAISSM